jgi:crotonobetainyl-CoA:carnitine CoA-transferase CaiB-like acyl-CoA transferase
VAEELGVDDPRVLTEAFAEGQLSPEETAALTEQIEAIFRTRTTEEWVAAFDRRGVPCAPVRATAEVFEDEQAAATNMIVELDHPVVGKIKMANSPLRMSEADTGSALASPALGQHTREVLSDLGYDSDAISRLEANGAVRAGPALVTPADAG